MTKNMFLFLVLLFIFFPAFSQFNDQLAKKSLVRVQVDGDGQKGICTGFLWKDPSQIVTALHAMKPNGKILITYPDKTQRIAQVMKVYKDADLVLLKTTTAPSQSADIAPISSFQPNVTKQEKLMAMGYYGGAQSKTTQPLEKGSADPETIMGIAPIALESMVQSIKFPSITFNIYYLSGSLLPGYSGCPIYNMKMELIGIGDGGLDQGQTNVSWCIPAANILKLENSQESLPANLGASKIHFTSDVSVPSDENANTGNNDSGVGAGNNSTAEDKPQEYTSFTMGEFNFYLTKTRSWDEMKETAVDPGNMESLMSDFATMNIKADPDYLAFDIYEDVNNGLVIAIPELAELYVIDEKSNLFGAKLSDVDLQDDDANKYFQLYYFTSERSADNPADALIAQLTSDFTPDYGGGVNIAPEYTKTYKIDEEWTADYRAFSAKLPIKDKDLGDVAAFYYINTIYNTEAVFNSVTVAYIPIERKDLMNAFENGVDCVGSYQGQNVGVCDFFESFLKIIAAAHLTTISY
ncbi:MAG TPA: serine protease [Chitinophagaceae bacterium]|nr:serine protease [Chitinophagaceae bacterium]